MLILINIKNANMYFIMLTTREETKLPPLINASFHGADIASGLFTNPFKNANTP